MEIMEAIELLKAYKDKFSCAEKHTYLGWLNALEDIVFIKDLRQEFIDWAPNKKPVRGKTASKETLEKYVQYLSCLENPVAASGKKCGSGWDGVIEFVTGKRQPKEYYQVTSVAEFDEIFGILQCIFDGVELSEGVIKSNYDSVLSWASTAYFKHHSCFPAAYKAYREFLEWREAQNKPEDKKDELPPVDRLAVALKFFAEKRNVDPIEWWASCDEWAKKVRENFAKADAGMFVAEGFDYAGFMHNFVYNVTVANSYFSKHTEEQKTEVGNFLAQNRNSPKAASWYMDESHFPQVGGSKIPGFGSGVALNFMMKVRPSEFATYSSMIDDMLVFAGVLKSPLPKDVTVEAYEQSKSLQGVVMQKMHEMGIGKAADDNSPADYLTVNEFAWWLNNGKNKDLIKEKVMKAQWKPVDSKAKMKNGTKKLKDAMSDDMLKRLAAALRTKPFAILAGHSGTGKSRLVRRLAYMTCNNEMLIEEGKGKSAPGNYCMVQVKPNWHDSTDLLGYYSEMGERHFVNTPFVEFICKAYAYPDTPFFVCLDEMNLAPVEQYFAEYLSAVESMEKKDGVWVTDALVDVDKTEEPGADGKQKASSEIVGQIMKGAASTEAAEWIQAHGLTIPKNLFVVGTVNMDETTCQFSRKVLDRAMTLLMNEVKFSEMANSKKPSEEELLDADGIKFFLEGEGTGAVGGIESGLLDGVNEQLGNTPFVIAYRFANEYALYEAAWAKLSDMDMAAATDDEKKNLAAKALDHVVMMKLLPRIHGERRVVEGIFNGRKDKRADGDKDLPGLKVKLPDGLSAKMMDEILARRDEYLTFWP